MAGACWWGAALAAYVVGQVPTVLAACCQRADSRAEKEELHHCRVRRERCDVVKVVSPKVVECRINTNTRPTATPEDDRGEKAEPRRYALLTLIRNAHFA